MSSHSIKIGCNTGAWAIAERFAALPIEIPPNLGAQDKLVWEKVDILLNTREPLGDKEEEVELLVPQGLRITAYSITVFAGKRGVLRCS